MKVIEAHSNHAGPTAYSNYKPVAATGVTRIPAHWRLVRMRYVLALRPSPSEAAHFDPKTIVTFLPMEAIGDDGTFDASDERPMDDVSSGYSYFRDGDVIRAKVTPCFENRKGASVDGLQNGIGFGTTELFVLRPGPSVDGKFLYYLTVCDLFTKLGEATIYGAHGVKRVDDEFVKNFTFGLPPLPEQRAIADYLDCETARIDALIDRHEQVRSVLTERLNSDIFFSVTKGNCASRLRDSGVAWIGQIPEHWSVRRLKQVAKLESGHTPSRQHPEYWENCTIPWVSLTDVAGFRDDSAESIYDTNEYVSELGLANSSARLLPAGTVILSRTASVGFSCILGHPMATTQDFADWICGPDLRPEYLLYVFRAMRQEFSRLTMGSTHSTIYMPDISKFIVPVPPISEQEAIVSHIRERRNSGLGAIARIDKQVDLFRQRRQALITSAVTGQIEVGAGVT